MFPESVGKGQELGDLPVLVHRSFYVRANEVKDRSARAPCSAITFYAHGELEPIARAFGFACE